LFPEGGDEDGWRCTGGGVLRLLGDDVVPQRIGRGEVVRGMRQGKIERIEERRRGWGLLIGEARRRNGPALIGNLFGEESYCGKSPAGLSARGRGRLGQLTGGAELSVGEGGERGTGSGKARWAAGYFLFWAERVPRGPFSYFLFFSSFSFSVFLFLLYLLQKMLQINSNHFQKFSKNQCNDLTLQEN
jgi:hypothetical protein